MKSERAGNSLKREYVRETKSAIPDPPYLNVASGHKIFAIS